MLHGLSVEKRKKYRKENEKKRRKGRKIFPYAVCKAINGLLNIGKS